MHKKIPDVKIKRKLFEHYLKGICSLTSQYGIYRIEIKSPNAFHDRYLIQIENVDIEFSKVFTQNSKSKQHQNSQRANSIFTNDVFSLIYSYISILELKEPQSDSPTQTSRHTTVRQEIHIFSNFLNAIREDLTSNFITQHVKHELQKVLAWFIIDYVSHNIDLIAQSRINFRPRNIDDETVLAEQKDYFWDPEWSHESFINIPIGISSQTISTISIHKDYVRVYPLTIDATPLNYNSFFPERTGINSLNSTFMNHDNLNRKRNLTQLDIQIPSHFISEEIIETITTTEAQRSISSIQPKFTIPNLKNPTLQQTILQSTVKASVAQKYSKMDYPTFRPVKKHHTNIT